MNQFQLNELKGRELLETELNQWGVTDKRPAEGEYNPVDYYFTHQDQTVVAEIKVRDKSFEGFPTHYMEVKKFDALLKDRKEKGLQFAYYINYFVDENGVTAYWYSIDKIARYAKKIKQWCNKTTAAYSERILKDILEIPKEIAKIHRFENNKWVNVN